MVLIVMTQFYSLDIILCDLQNMENSVHKELV